MPFCVIPFSIKNLQQKRFPCFGSKDLHFLFTVPKAWTKNVFFFCSPICIKSEQMSWFLCLKHQDEKIRIGRKMEWIEKEFDYCQKRNNVLQRCRAFFFAKCVPNFFMELKNSFSFNCTFDYVPGVLCSNTLKVLNEKAVPCKCLRKNKYAETVREKMLPTQIRQEKTNFATKMENKNVTDKWSAFKVLLIFWWKDTPS